MVSKELISYVSTNTTLTLGTDLFWGIFPNDTRAGIIISDLPGIHNESGMGGFQILVNSRYKDYNTALTKIHLVYDLLAFSNGFNLTTYTVFNTVSISTPGFLGRDDIGNVLFGALIRLYTEV